MVKVNLPPGCAGIADGEWRRMADKPGGFINLDDTDPVEKRQLQKLKNQDYASAGLVDAGPEKHFVRRGPEGRWCPHCPCNTIYHSWTKVCPSCGLHTILESEMTPVKLTGQYQP
jgi:hypothetical protein